MSIEHLQELIRSCKTPIALQLNPDLERVSPKIRKNFTDLYGDCPMSRAETLRYHGSQLDLPRRREAPRRAAAGGLLSALRLHGHGRAQ